MDLMNAHLYLLHHRDAHNRLATRTDDPIFSYNQLFVNNRNMQVYTTIIHREKQNKTLFIYAQHFVNCVEPYRRCSSR